MQRKAVLIQWVCSPFERPSAGIIISLMSLLASTGIYAQSCAGCAIDYSYSTPGLYPSTLPPATAGEYYETDITFVLQEDTTVEILGSELTFAFLNYYIMEPIGAPFGINATSNLGPFPVDYDPAESLYGCVRICGTPLIPGTYNITVPFIATLEDPAGDQPAEFELILEVLPATGTGGIIASSLIGCSPASIDFSTSISSGGSDGFSYFWDFGDGSSSTEENPGTVTFTTTDTATLFPVMHAVTIDTFPYTLDYITVLSTDCNDCLILVGCTGLTPSEKPDLYLQFPDLGFVTDVFVDTDPPLTFVLGWETTPGAEFMLSVKDDDSGGFGGDGNCGNLTITIGEPGVFTATLPGGSVVEYSISHPVLAYTFYDTVTVFPTPDIPLISTTDVLTACDGDTITLYTSTYDDTTLQWYADGTPIPGAENDTLLVTTSGSYYVVATAPGGCTSAATAVVTELLDYPFPPFIYASAFNVLETSSDYPLQWYYEGNAIPGATDSVYTAALEGNYQVAISNGPCVTFSSVYALVFNSVSNASNNISIAPNPFTNTITIEQELSRPMHIQLLDLQGRLVASKTSAEKVIHLYTGSELPSGTYLLRVQDEQAIFLQQLMVKIAE